jgi:hypothetical protein
MLSTEHCAFFFWIALFAQAAIAGFFAGIFEKIRDWQDALAGGARLFCKAGQLRPGFHSRFIGALLFFVAGNALIGISVWGCSVLIKFRKRFRDFTRGTELYHINHYTTQLLHL